MAHPTRVAWPSRVSLISPGHCPSTYYTRRGRNPVADARAPRVRATWSRTQGIGVHPYAFRPMPSCKHSSVPVARCGGRGSHHHVSHHESRQHAPSCARVQVTAGNASPITDGAAAVIVASYEVGRCIPRQ
jgi:hypothetical protein